LAIQNGRVSTNDILDSAVTTAKIKDDAVESEKIGDNEVITATILDANVTNAKLGTDISAAKLTAGTIPDARFPATLPAANGSALTNLTAGNLSSGTVPTARLGSGTADSNTFLRGDSTFAAPASTSTVVPYNPIINGDFMIWQRGTTINATSTATINSDDKYICDRWILLSDGNDIVDVARVSDAPDGGSGKSCELKVETANKKFGIVQIIEQINCHDMLGETVSLSLKLRVSATTNLDDVRAAIVSWSGTADSVTSDIVSAWEAEGTNPTLASNWTYENTPADLNVTTSWAEYKIENVDIDTSGAANIGVFIWSNVTGTAVDEQVFITDVQLNKGATAGAFERKSFNTVEYECLRYYETSMDWGLTGQYAGQNVVIANDALTFNASVGNLNGVNLRYRKRTTPTLTIYHQDGTAGAVYGPIIAGAKVTGVTAQHLNTLGCLFINKASAFYNGRAYYYGFIAESEL
jgi:hypothetical protein